MKVGNGRNILLWKDTWLYDKPICILYPDLFKMCCQPNIIVAQMKMSPNSVTFTRWLVDDISRDWESILRKLDKIHLTNAKDHTF